MSTFISRARKDTTPPAGEALSAHRWTAGQLRGPSFFLYFICLGLLGLHFGVNGLALVISGIFFLTAWRV